MSTILDWYQGIVIKTPPTIVAPCPNSGDLAKNSCTRKFWPNLAKNKSTPKRSNLVKKGAKIIWIYSVNEQKGIKILEKNSCPRKFWPNLTKNNCTRKKFPNLAKNSRSAIWPKFLNLKGGVLITIPW